MYPLPAELLTLTCSSLFGGVMQLMSRSLEIRRQERLFSMQMLGKPPTPVRTVRAYESRAFQWTRRIIALTAIFSVIVFPKIVAVWMPEIAVHIGYPQESQGFLFLFSGVTKIKWVTMHGLVITPLDTHLLSAIVGLYFGGSLAGHR